MAKRGGETREVREQLQKDFLKEFEACGDIDEASKSVGIAFSTPFAWENASDDFRASFSRARALVSHLLVKKADEIIETTVKELRDETMIKIHRDVGNPIARLRMLQSDRKVWLAGKWNREVYGDKQDVSLSGTVALPAPTLNVHDAPKTETPT